MPIYLEPGSAQVAELLFDLDSPAATCSSCATGPAGGEFASCSGNASLCRWFYGEDTTELYPFGDGLLATVSLACTTAGPVFVGFNQQPDEKVEFAGLDTQPIPGACGQGTFIRCVDPCENVNCDDGDPCTSDSCDTGTGTCSHSLLGTGTVCRAAVSSCDIAEFCTGASPHCPEDAVASQATVCRPSAGICDAAEQCTGTSTVCPSDAHAAGGTVCRPPTTQCDVAEACDGSSAHCPVDTFAPSTLVCRSSAGRCDPEERCTGTTSTCPSDLYSPKGKVCRSAKGVCDAAETCAGSAPQCPTEKYLGPSTICRASAGECDLVEACSGSGIDCPADRVATTGTPCTSDGNDCTTDHCGDAGTCGHVGHAGICDDGVFCNGGDTCLDGACIVHDGDPCAGPDGDGDCGESCDEAAGNCFAADPEGTSCNDGSACTIGDICSGGACNSGPRDEELCLGASTTTTTIPEPPLCGDLSGDGRITSSDALLALRAAVGQAACDPDVCDFNGDSVVTASDALLILKRSVGQPIEPACPTGAPALDRAGASTTTTSLATEGTDSRTNETGAQK